MIEKVLVPVDGSPQAQAAIEYTRTVFSDTTILLLTVIDPVDGFAGYSGDETGNWETRARAEAESLLADARTNFGESSDVETDVIIGDPIDTIVATAQNRDMDQIVMGSHGRDGVQRLLIGSVAEQVMRKAAIPVTIAQS